MSSKLGQLGLWKQILMSDLNLECYFISRFNDGRYDMANIIACPNNLISISFNPKWPLIHWFYTMFLIKTIHLWSIKSIMALPPNNMNFKVNCHFTGYFWSKSAILPPSDLVCCVVSQRPMRIVINPVKKSINFW